MKRSAKKYAGCLAVIACMLVLFAAGNVRAATKSVTYKVTYQQSSAREVFAMVNRLRTGGSWYWNESDTQKIQTGKLSALTYDYDLEKAAMQRAAELAIYYSHTRPDGSKCNTAVNTWTAYGENIAAGWGECETAAEAYDGWLEENEMYNGQGHRRNMLSTNFTAIGIGHVQCEGRDYWAMELRNPVVSTTATPANNGTVSFTTNVEESFLTGVSLNTYYPIPFYLGTSAALELNSTLVANADAWICEVPISATYQIISEDPSVVAVSGETLTALKSGSAKIKVSAATDFETTEKIITVTVSQIDLAYAEISLPGKEYDYTGAAICPEPVLTYDGETLKKGVDYTLTYTHNKDKGTAYVSAVGQGKCTGMKADSFIINAVDITKKKAALEKTEYVYDGKLKEPAVKISGLVKDTDFRVQYDNNRTVGKAYATVIGINNYKGTLKLEFSIVSNTSNTTDKTNTADKTKTTDNTKTTDSKKTNEKAPSLSRPVIKSAKNVKGKKIKLTWKKQKGVSGYQIKYTAGKTSKKATVKKASTVKKTIKKLKKGKTYTIKIRSFKKADGKTYYSKWSKKKKVKVKK